MTSKTDRNGHSITYAYDQLNRLTQKTYPDNSTVIYTYDNASRLTQVSDPTGTYQFTFDNMGRLTGTTTAYAFLTGRNFTTSYVYDAASNRTGFTDPENGATGYVYDTLNRLQTLTPPAAFSGTGNFGFSYDALSRRTQLTRPNAVTTTYGYDTLSRLLNVTHKKGTTTLDGATYTVDSAGNRLSRTPQPSGTASNYGYDAIYELTGATQGHSTTESYTYDAVGNRLSAFHSSGWTYNSSNELTSRPSFTYTYDNNGNTLTSVTGSNTTTYAWDFENRLTSVTLPGSGGTVNFKYDPLGRRIYKSSSSGTSIYAYDADNLVEETNSSGTAVARYAQGLSIDEPLALLRGGATSFYDADGLGSVTSLSNAAGSIANTYTYDSFGKVTASTGSLVNPFQYTARESDTETGLYYYRARYLDPWTGRFLREDPARFNAGPNFYAYVGNSPISYLDPFGLDKYVLIVGQSGLGEHNVGQAFQLAALTEAADLRAAGNDVTIVNASSVSDFNSALVNSGNIDGGVEYFGHSSYDRLYIGENPGAGTNLTAANVSDLSNAHLGENATIALLGCFAGSGGDLSIAQMIANQLHRNVTAFPNSAFFGGAKCPKNSHPRDRAPSKVPVRVCQQGGAGPLTFYPKR